LNDVILFAYPSLKITGFPRRQPGFEPRPDHVGFVVSKVALGQVFSEYFSYPYQSFHRLLHTSSSIIRGRYNRPNSGRRTMLTQIQPTPGGGGIKIKKLICLSPRANYTD
jgi:hypothetical protein